MSKYMVRCDMEGVSGVVSEEQTNPARPGYQEGRRVFMSDLMALVGGLADGGASEVVVYDEHYYGRNVDFEMLKGNVSVICGKPPYREDWAGGLDSSFAGLVLLGFHSKAGTPGGLLNHSYEPDIRNILLNGLSVGEIGMEAAIAGDFGVPLVMVTADSAGTAEAENLVSGVATVAVKESLHESGGRCLPIVATSKSIRETAARIVQKPPEAKPYRVNSPVDMDVELNDGPYLEAMKQLYPGLIRNGRIVTLKGKSATALWSEYWRMKLECQSLIAKESGI